MSSTSSAAFGGRQANPEITAGGPGGPADAAPGAGPEGAGHAPSEQGPNLFVVGAMKGATTSIFESLSAHPEIFVPAVKEPHHFSTDLFTHADPFIRWTRHGFANIRRIRARARYLKLYAAAPSARYRVDASTSYLYSAAAARNISQFQPDAKIIILLRDPVMRAWSEYKMNLAIGVELRTFRDALDAEQKLLIRGKQNPYQRYLRASLYGPQVEAYYSQFPAKNIFIDVIDNPRIDMTQVMLSLSEFLGLSPDMPLGPAQQNVARSSFSMPLNSFLYFTGFKKLIGLLTPRDIKNRAKSAYYRPDNSMPSSADQAHLAALLEDSTRRLEQVTGLDLSFWTRPTPWERALSAKAANTAVETSTAAAKMRSV
jgi:hypothetical protein